ncbi:MAG: hypothetical protein GF384_07465 [Elusimicrobia bacterium]|nr:hypothetical protein [Elusimicrobiota bacterium]
MASLKKPSLLFGILLNILWPGLGQMYFRKVKRGIFFAVMALFIPFIMIIAACIDLYLLNKRYVATDEDTWPDFDVNWKKPLKIILVALFMVILGYSLYFLSFYLWIARMRQSAAERTLQEMQTVKAALSDFYKDQGYFPQSLSELAGRRPLRNLWASDGWGQSYRYRVHNGGYELVSAGKDGAFDTEDDLYLSGP